VNLNAREKKIAIGVLAAVVLMILYYVAFQPYSDARAQVVTDLTKVRGDLEHADTTFSRERKLRPVWNDMQKGGLNVDPAQAERQTLEALNVWARDAGLTLVTYKPERTTQEGTFQVVGISASGTGSMPQVARMLASIETAGIPVRVNDMTLTPAKEGTDDLTVRFSLSALCQPPAAPAAKPNGTSNGGQSS
jgi:hypothetical protein